MDTSSCIKQDRLKLLPKKILNFRKLINDLNIGDKGNITINVKVSKNLDATGDEAIFVEAQLSTKYPKVVISDNNAKKLPKMARLFKK